MLLMVSGAAVAASDRSSDTPVPADLSNAIVFREDFGLPSDKTFVEGTFADSRYTTDDYGVPLSPKEAADVDRRFAPDLGPIVEYGQKHADIFGGVWIDQKAGGVVHIGLTNVTDVDTWTSFVPEGLVGVVDRVDHTISELDDEIARLNDARAIGALDFDLAAVSTATNTVIVESPTATVQQLQSVGKGPIHLYSDSVTYLPLSCPLSDCSNPYWGGIHILAPTGSGGDFNNCTGAWSFEGSIDWLTTDFEFTAGHCIDGAEDGASWRHPGTIAIGTSAAYTNGGSYGDIGVIQTAQHVGTDEFFISDHPLRHLVATQVLTDDYEGEGVCKQGEKTGYSCSTIIANNASIRNMTQMRLTDSDLGASPGDSGAPMFWQTTAFGILSGELSGGLLDGKYVYTQVRRARNWFDQLSVFELHHFCMEDHPC
jgi:hypothetical protein